MSAIATKFQATVAAAAVATAVAVAPIAAHATPNIQIPAAPVTYALDHTFALSPALGAGNTLQQTVPFGTAPLDPFNDLIVLLTTAALNVVSAFVIQPAAFVAQAIAGISQGVSNASQAFVNALGHINLQFCIGGTSIKIGPYGKTTTGTC
jgi:hypothetical protein